MEEEGPSSYFDYQRLENREIRLIKIHGAGQMTSYKQIEVDIHTEILDTATFDALSYVWGPPTFEDEEAEEGQIFTTIPRCYPLICDGQILRVTKSLRDALRRLRDMEEPYVAEYFNTQANRTKTPYLWADGVCINQDDLDERSQQVALMGDLYRKAKTVFAWVGEEMEDGRPAITLSMALSKLRDEALKGRSSAGLSMFMTRLEDPDLFAKVGIPLPTAEDWRHWATFLARPWFRRTWVIQEAVLSGGYNTFVLCSKLSAQMIALLQGLSTVIGLKWLLPIMAKVADNGNPRWEKRANIIYTSMQGAHPYFWIWRAWAEGKALRFETASQWLLPRTSCSDPRDYVYATLGFAREWQERDKAMLPIDYTLGPAEVFTRATKHLIRDLGHLRMLSCVLPSGVHPPLAGLPSWSVDYAAKKASYRGLLEKFGENVVAPWCASKDSKHEWVPEDPLKRLTVRGVACDRIVGSAPLDQFGIRLGVWPGILHVLHNLLVALPTDSARDALTESLAKVLLADSGDPEVEQGFEYTFDQNKPLISLALTMSLVHEIWYPQSDRVHKIQAELLAMETWMQRIMHLSKTLPSRLPSLTHLKREMHRRISLGPSPSESEDCISRIVGFDAERTQHCLSAGQAMATVGARRRIFATDHGRLGIGPENLRDGDEVWILAGSKVPFVLRGSESGGSYAFLAEAYVDGLMNGELWPDDGEGISSIILT